MAIHVDLVEQVGGGATIKGVPPEVIMGDESSEQGASPPPKEVLRCFPPFHLFPPRSSSCVCVGNWAIALCLGRPRAARRPRVKLREETPTVRRSRTNST
eukprot:scaffold109226_cov24-Tisochrysis_lutea.AAC.1